MKKIIILIAIIATLAAVLITRTQDQRYQAQILPVSFELPEGYVALEENDAVTILLEGDYQSIQRGEREGGEFPPAISIRFFNNNVGLTPLAWAERYPQLSNYNLIMGSTTPTTVSGKPGIIYSADGLYPSRNIIFGDSGMLYHISGSYLDQESPLYQDFLGIVDSLTVE